MKTFLLLTLLLAIALSPGSVRADGCFVAPKFVWDKHKDINEPTQKAILVYDAGHEDLILQVKYEGPVDEFGWLIPVPNLPTVQEGSMKCFYELSQYTQKLSERPGYSDSLALRGVASLADAGGKISEPPVKVVEIKTVGAYKIAVLSAKDSSDLKKWLDENHFFLPSDKFDVINSYVEKQWYFVAVKINLDESSRGLVTTSAKLASGELNPLQISFASDRCVFPLKISSINGKASEVQVYVLSPEPLVEKGMLYRQLPLINSNDVERAARQAAWEAKMEEKREYMGRATWPWYDEPTPETQPQAEVKKQMDWLSPLPEELLPYTKVTAGDLPECSGFIPMLNGKSWWVTKQTWTFKPEEMRDLTFEPAWPIFTGMLTTKYGYYAAPELATCGTNGITLLLQAMQNPSPIARINVAYTFDSTGGWPYVYSALRSPQVHDAALEWITNREPAVRIAGLFVLQSWNRDDTKFRNALVSLLNDPDREVRASAILDAYPMGHERVPDAVLMALLKSPDHFARELGLGILAENENKQSVELALPLLNDPSPFVKDMAYRVLLSITGQDFTDEQTNEWQSWWDQNRTNFVAIPRAERIW